MRADLVEVERVIGGLAKMSSSFYALIPMGEGKDDITKPITNEH